MSVLYQPDGQDEQEIPFRGSNGLFGGSWENTFGRSLGPQDGVPAAPIVVRFQGARVTGIIDPCELDIHDPASPLVAGSLTPWVAHPAEFNDLQPPPNIIRFTVIFDQTRVPGDIPAETLSVVNGITDLWIRALPD